VWHSILGGATRGITGSVAGDDCRLLLWDFSVGMLHRPKALQSTARQRNSSVTTNTPQANRRRTESLTDRVRSDSIRTDDREEMPFCHPVVPRARTAQLPPIMSKAVGEDPVCWLGFLEDCIMTSSLEGHIRSWDRPREGVNDSTSRIDSSAPIISALAVPSTALAIAGSDIGQDRS